MRLGEVARRLERSGERLVSRDRRRIDRPVAEELAQDVNRVPWFVVGEVRFRQLEEDVGDTRFGAANGRQKVPGPIAVTASKGVSRRLQTPAGTQEERHRLVEPSSFLEDERGLGELPGSTVEDDRALPVLQLAVDVGRGLGFSCRLVRRSGLGQGARLQEKRGGPVDLSRLSKGPGRLERLSGPLVEQTGLLPLLRLRPGVGGTGPVGLPLEVPGDQLGGDLFLSGLREGAGGARQVAPPLQLPGRLQRPAGREVERPGKKRLPAQAERFGRLERPARRPGSLPRSLPERVLAPAESRPLGDLPGGVGEGDRVARGLGDLGQPVPAGRLPRFRQRDGPRGGSFSGLSRRLPGLRRLPRERVPRLAPELGRETSIPLAHLERGNAGRLLPLPEGPLGLFGVARLQEELAGANEVSRAVRLTRREQVRVRRAGTPESQQKQGESDEVDREAGDAVAGEELVDRRLREEPGDFPDGRHDASHQGEELVEVYAEDDDSCEQETDDG